MRGCEHLDETLSTALKGWTGRDAVAGLLDAGGRRKDKGGKVER